MTEQEYRNKKNELKQVKQNITDLSQREHDLRREIAKYDANEYLYKYFYDADSQQWLRPIKLHGEEIIFVSISTYRDAIDNYITEYFIEQEYYWLDQMPKLKEISEEEFTEGVNKILDAARKIIFGDEKP